MKDNHKILITGSSGLIGSSLKLELERQGYKKIYLVNRSNCNLLNLESTKKYLTRVKPDYIFHLANFVRGIGGNKKQKFKMLNDNILMNTNLFKCVSEIKLKKIIIAGSAAAYSDKYKINIKEENYLKSKPHITEREYGYSKRIMLMQADLLKQEHKINYCYAILNNVYGINDYFNDQDGHVVPSLILRCYESLKNNKNFEIWGSSEAKRCFLYSKDAARILIKLAKQNKYNLINVSSSKEYKISDLVNLIKEIFKSNKEIKWINRNIKYVKRRSLDLNKLNQLKIKEKYSLKEGLEETIIWFKKNYPNIRGYEFSKSK